MQSSQSSPESNPEVELLSDVYDNDFVEEMRTTRAQQLENNATTHERKGEIQPTAQVQ